MRYNKYSGMTFGEASIARKADREANAAANAAKREARKAATMHCQCCGRDILANKGLIAHHGYERPGHGWQTASCMGAKRLPFEVDRTALGEMITFLRNRLKDHKAHRKAIADEKRPILFRYKEDLIGPHRGPFTRPRYTYGDWWPKVARKFEVTRKTFKAFSDHKQPNDIHYGCYDYKTYKARHIEGLDQTIKNLTQHIEEEQARYDGWKQTHKRNKTNTEWIKI